MRGLVRLAPVLLTVFVAVTGASASPTLSDPPALVPWTKIGDIGLGMYKSRVQYEYGTDGDGFHLIQRLGLFYGKNAEQGYYVLHGSHVVVSFYGSRVGEIGWTTPYYRTKAGFGVGSTIPLGVCHKTSVNPCEYRWNGFVFEPLYNQSPCNCWLRWKPTFHEYDFIYTKQRRVTGFYLATRYPG